MALGFLVDRGEGFDADSVNTIAGEDTLSQSVSAVRLPYCRPSLFSRGAAPFPQASECQYCEAKIAAAWDGSLWEEISGISSDAVSAIPELLVRILRDAFRLHEPLLRKPRPAFPMFVRGRAVIPYLEWGRMLLGQVGGQPARAQRE